jgi:predicted TIM-barrel fold metal-dependent hydrolase
MSGTPSAQANVTVPQLPPGSCDCHAHVFGPFERYPLADPRPYTPPLAPFDTYLEMLTRCGFSRGILVHGGANGWDQGATRDALAAARDQLRGVAVVPVTTPDSVLAELHSLGFRAMRFTEVAGPNAAKPFAGRLGLSDLRAFAPRLRELGWHAQIWANCQFFEEHESTLRALELPLVIDHMGYFDVARGVLDGAFQTLLRLLAEGVVWVKVTAFRNSKLGMGYEDVRPFMEALVATRPDRLLWGSDWPFLGMSGAHQPDPARLVATLLEWVPDTDVREQILVRNPAVLYGFT